MAIFMWCGRHFWAPILNIHAYTPFVVISHKHSWARILKLHTYQDTETCAGPAQYRYDVEQFQKIEHLINVRMEEFPAQRDEVLILLERVGEAQRLATMQMKESDGGGEWCGVWGFLCAHRCWCLRH